jgi:hypothetical protein
MSGTIFINYRREDSISIAGRLYDRLSHTFGRKNIFMDVDHIPAASGVPYAQEPAVAVTTDAMSRTPQCPPGTVATSERTREHSAALTDAG